jgi:ABC-type transporter Mla subunit MlaD
MAHQNYFKLGLFVLASGATLLLLLFLLGGRSLLQPRYTVETYFNESVSGLAVGSPVKFRGVPVGQVSEITISSNRYQTGRTLVEKTPYVLVRIQLVGISAHDFEQLQQAVDAGLRVQTHLAGITGQLYLSLDLLDPRKNPALPISWKPDYLYLPSAPSASNRIVANVEHFLADLDRAEISQLGQNLNRLVVSLGTRVDEADIRQLTDEALVTLKSLRATVGRIDKLVDRSGLDETLRHARRATARAETILSDPAFDSIPGDIAAVAQRTRVLVDEPQLDQMIQSANKLVARLDGLVGATQYDARAAIEDLRVSMENLRALSASARRYPAGLLFGDPPSAVLPTAEKR